LPLKQDWFACMPVVYLFFIPVLSKKMESWLYMVVVIATAMASVCYYTMPTLRNRIQYVAYDFSNYSKGNMMPGYGDASRWLSIRAGMRSWHNILLPVLVLVISAGSGSMAPNQSSFQLIL
jgi:hypothetical protein